VAADGEDVEALVGGVVCVVAVVAGLFSIRSWKLRAERSRALARVASTNGFSFSEVAGPSVLRIPFELFRAGDGQGAQNLLQGKAPDGAPVQVFDYFFYEEEERSQGQVGWLQADGDEAAVTIPSRTYTWFTVCVTELDLVCPPTTIERKGAVLRALGAVGLRSMEFESEAFNRRFLVSSEDSRFLQHLITPGVMDLLLTTEGKVRFELRGRWLLAALDRDDVTPDLFLALVGLTTELRRRFPPILREMTTSLPPPGLQVLPNLDLPGEAPR
jgi:hypothetical protein